MRGPWRTCGEGLEQGGSRGPGSSRTNAQRGESRGPLWEPPRLLFFLLPPPPPPATPIRALFVCAQEPGQSCANSEVEPRSVRKFGGRTGIRDFSRWNSESRRWNEALLEKPPQTAGEVLVLCPFWFRCRGDGWITAGILLGWTHCDGFVKPGFHSALPGLPDAHTRGGLWLPICLGPEQTPH